MAMAGAYALGAPALAQDPRPSFRISAPIFFQHSFNTDLDGGGDFSVSRFATGVATEWDIKPDLTLVFRATYELNLYDFNGMSDLGDPDPWDDIHSLTLDTRLQWAVEPDWFVFGGPVFKFARESGAPMEDGFTGGATIGATHVFNPGLIVGAGVFVTSELEDDVKVYPLIIFDWTINERWRLRSTPGPRNIAEHAAALVPPR